MLQFHCECQYLFAVPPTSFSPSPKVDSAVVRLIPFTQPKFDVGEYQTFAAIVKSAFGQRRKTLSNSLRALLDRDAILACNIDPGLRAENLDIADFAVLSRSRSR